MYQVYLTQNDDYKIDLTIKTLIIKSHEPGIYIYQ